MIAAVLLLSSFLCFCESIFSSYDFTFYRTVSESLAIKDSSSIGFDYTGFGFIGNRNTNGLFMRIGIRIPYSTLANLAVEEEQSLGLDTGGDDIVITTGSGNDSEGNESTNEFRFTFILGPAVRYVFSPSFDAYAGVGLKVEEEIVSTFSGQESITNVFNTVIAVDFDLGFKFNLEKNTSCRIGLYGTYELLSYTHTNNSSGGSRTYATSDIHLNFISFGQGRIPLSALGYISVGKTFSSARDKYVYSYSITSRELGKGRLTIVDKV